MTPREHSDSVEEVVDAFDLPSNFPQKDGIGRVYINCASAKPFLKFGELGRATLKESSV